ncbi:MAG: hypothetical protein JW953_13365 [Anaerolineae bacterium]|nr:hypothetical protein [Anaerolineae bacterium]
MSKAIQTQLNRYFEDLRFEEEESEPSPKVIGILTEAIGRCYDLLGKNEESSHYFTLASEAYLESLTGPLIRPDEDGDNRLSCARVLWRTGDERAREYFQQSLEEYQKGYKWELESVQYSCRRGSIFCFIFLEDYTAAITAAEITYAMQCDLNITGTATETLKTVIKNCQKNDVAAHKNSVMTLEEYFKKERIELYWQSLIPEADVYEFVKRKLAELETKNQG